MTQQLINRRNSIAAAMALLGMRDGVPNATRTKKRGRTSYGSKSKKKYGSRGSPYSFIQRVRNVETAQHYIKTDSVLNTMMKHNTIYSHCPTSQIVTGTSNSTRTNDEIYLEAIKFKCFMHDTLANENAVTYKLWLVYIDEYHSVSGWDVSLGGGAFSFSNGLAFRVNEIIDPKKCTVLAEYTVTIKPPVADTYSSEMIEDTVPIQKSFVYRTGQNEGKSRNLMWICTSSVVGGSTGIDDTVYCYLTYDLIFKNSK